MHEQPSTCMQPIVYIHRQTQHSYDSSTSNFKKNKNQTKKNKKTKSEDWNKFVSEPGILQYVLVWQRIDITLLTHQLCYNPTRVFWQTSWIVWTTHTEIQQHSNGLRRCFHCGVTAQAYLRQIFSTSASSLSPGRSVHFENVLSVFLGLHGGEHKEFWVQISM